MRADQICSSRSPCSSAVIRPIAKCSPSSCGGRPRARRRRSAVARSPLLLARSRRGPPPARPPRRRRRDGRPGSGRARGAPRPGRRSPSRRCSSVPVEMICQTAFITRPISGLSARSPSPSPVAARPRALALERRPDLGDLLGMARRGTRGPRPRAGGYAGHARRRPRSGPRPRAARWSGRPSPGSGARRRRCARRSAGSPGSRSAAPSASTARIATRTSPRRTRGPRGGPLLADQAEQPGQPRRRSRAPVRRSPAAAPRAAPLAAAAAAPGGPCWLNRDSNSVPRNGGGPWCLLAACCVRTTGSSTDHDISRAYVTSRHTDKAFSAAFEPP